MEFLELDSCSSSSFSSSSFKPCSPGSESSSAEASPVISHKRKAGRKKFKETRHPVFRGVRQRKGNKWVCEVREPYKKSRIWLGTFRSPEMAARAYDVAALALRGKSAALNFPDSASILPQANSSSAKDIQAAAVAAAEAFKPTTCSCSPPSLCIDQGPGWSSTPISDEIVENDRGKKVLDDYSLLDHSESSETMADEYNNPLFIDEEALFNMPRLLESIAEGMLLTPPALRRAVDWNDDSAATINIDLWGDLTN